MLTRKRGGGLFGTGGGTQGFVTAVTVAQTIAVIAASREENRIDPPGSTPSNIATNDGQIIPSIIC